MIYNIKVKDLSLPRKPVLLRPSHLQALPPGTHSYITAVRLMPLDKTLGREVLMFRALLKELNMRTRDLEAQMT